MQSTQAILSVCVAACLVFAITSSSGGAVKGQLEAVGPEPARPDANRPLAAISLRRRLEFANGVPKHDPNSSVSFEKVFSGILALLPVQGDAPVRPQDGGGGEHDEGEGVLLAVDDAGDHDDGLPVPGRDLVVPPLEEAAARAPARRPGLCRRSPSWATLTIG